MAASEVSGESVGKDEEGSDTPPLKHQLPPNQVDLRPSPLDSYSTTSLAELLANGIMKGDAHSESGAVPNDTGKLSAVDAMEKREKLLSRQNSDRGGGGGGGGGNKEKKGEGQTGEMMQETGDIQVC